MSIGRRWFIYGLLNSNLKIFYVGKTRNVYRRMKEHRHRLLDRWPMFCILEVGIGYGWEQAERKWIRKFRHQLKNISPGGYGRDFLPESSRRKLSLKLKGRPKPESFRQKLKRNWRLGVYADRVVPKNAGQFKPGYSSPRKGGHREDLSEKSRKRISEKVSCSLIGNRRNTGKRWTEEQRAKLRGRIPWNKGLSNWQDVIGAKRRGES